MIPFFLITLWIDWQNIEKCKNLSLIWIKDITEVSSHFFFLSRGEFIARHFEKKVYLFL